jgi:DNA invertase Pin-like site-specific DNA recombinase
VLQLVEELDAAYARERTTARARRMEADGRRPGRRHGEDVPENAARYARARQMRLEGATLHAITAETGLAGRTLNGYFRRHGIPIPPRGRPRAGRPTAG